MRGLLLLAIRLVLANPPRNIPRGEHFLSPADGTVVYVKRAAVHEPVIVCKQGKAASINDIAKEDSGCRGF